DRRDRPWGTRGRNQRGRTLRPSRARTTAHRGKRQQFSLKGKIVFQASAQTCAWTVGFCALAILIGCVPVEPLDDSAPLEQVLASAPVPPPARPDSDSGSNQTPIPSSQAQLTTRHVEAEPNNTWVQAEPVAFGGSVEIAGTI